MTSPALVRPRRPGSQPGAAGAGSLPGSAIRRENAIDAGFVTFEAMGHTFDSLPGRTVQGALFGLADDGLMEREIAQGTMAKVDLRAGDAREEAPARERPGDGRPAAAE